jgi:hypothetical protein
MANEKASQKKASQKKTPQQNASKKEAPQKGDPTKTRARKRKKHLNRSARQFMPARDSDGDYFFLDEFVKKEQNVVIPNVPPDLEGAGNTLQDIAGYRFNHAPVGGAGYHFDRYARLLMDLIRDYNRALYRLRRHYFWKEHHRTMTELPNDQLNINEFDEIEDAYEAAFDRLVFFLKLPLLGDKDPLTGLPLFVEGNVDCIRANDYIVSVRIGATASDQELNTEKEIPYSSSSHISISSTFSSYSSWIPGYPSSSSWQAQP